MTRLLKYIFALSMLLFSASSAFSQGGMRFSELSKKLEPYFADDLIDDIKNQLPQQSSFSIWGWDVGDFSGDGFTDVALSVKFNNEKQKFVEVFMFVDVDGFLNPVAQLQYEYFELPLEIGVSIKNNTCYVTQKKEQFNWFINGYRFDNGSLVLLDEFHTKRIEKFTNETYKNYQTLTNWNKYLLLKNNEVSFNNDYYVVPAYYRGKFVYKGFNSEIFVNNPEYAYKGAFHWSGDDDASFSLKSAYDEENIYLTFNVKDDEIVPERQQDQPADYLELWFDFSDLSKNESREISRVKDNSIKIKETVDSGIYSLKIYPGDFLETKPYVKALVSSNELDEEQESAVSKIRVVAAKNKTGYVVKVKIPFKLFGFEEVPLDGDNMCYVGFTAILNDIDNEFRPEEVTRLASSRFVANNPSTFGTLVIVPGTRRYGEANNIYRDDILKSINELGF